MGTNSSPEFPYPGGTPGAEPPDPVAGKPGHFAWSRWVKQYVKNLNANLMAHQDATDPHPVYLTKAEGDSLYTGSGGGVAGPEEVALGPTLPTVEDLWVNTADAGSGYPTSEIAVYKMMWATNAGRVSTLPAQVNVVRLAFVQGSPPALVGYGAEGKATLIADLIAFRGRGNKVMLSYGGGGGSIDTTKPDEIIASYNAIKADLEGNVDGLDWDVEMAGAGMDLNGVLKVSKAIAAQGGAISFVPNGSNVDAYLPSAAACQDAGCLDSYGHQYYDAPVDAAAVRHRINQALNEGIPISKISLGMMIGNAGEGDNLANYWTNQQCHDYMAQFMGEFPGMQRAYLWHMSRTGTAQWITDMDSLLPDPTTPTSTVSLKYRDPVDHLYKLFPSVGMTPSEIREYVDSHEWNFAVGTVDGRGWDLNGVYRTGFYEVTFDSLNAPAAESGYLTVWHERTSGVANSAAQMWVGHQSPARMFIRNAVAGVWSAWVQLGSGGAGSTDPVWPAAHNSLTTDLNTLKTVGFHEVGNTAANAPVAEYGYLIATRERSGTATDGDYCAQIWISQDSPARMYLRLCEANVWKAWVQVTGGGGGGAPTTRILTAGSGLTGGGDLSADRTFNVGAGAGIIVAADTVAVDLGTSGTQAAYGNHTHTGVYDPAGTAAARTPKITVATTAPGSPAVGDIWVDTN